MKEVNNEGINKVRKMKTVVELIEEEAVEEFISPVEYNDEKSVIILDVVVV